VEAATVAAAKHASINAARLVGTKMRIMGSFAVCVSQIRNSSAAVRIGSTAAGQN
jgi:hypothetical protein